jgi:hypothetical protein
MRMIGSQTSVWIVSIYCNRERAYINKKVPHGQRQYSLGICWLPKALLPRPKATAAADTSTPITQKKSVKEVIVKQEVKEEPWELLSACLNSGIALSGWIFVLFSFRNRSSTLSPDSGLSTSRLRLRPLTLDGTFFMSAALTYLGDVLGQSPLVPPTTTC